MKNNDGKGLYEIGERHQLNCGCVIVAEKEGYTHYIAPNCQYDNKYHADLKNYKYRSIEQLTK